MRLLLWRHSFVAFIHVLYLYAGRHIPGVCVVFFFLWFAWKLRWSSGKRVNEKSRGYLQRQAHTNTYPPSEAFL